MKQINIDIETYSSTDLGKSGVYRYSESPDFEVLLFGYAVDRGEVKVVDLTAGEIIPASIQQALSDPKILKYAYNAQFERVCLSRFLRRYLSPDGWRCTMVASLYLGLPGSLASVGEVLGVEKQKLTEGKDLVRYFCVPCKATKSNGGRTRNLPEHARDKWERFVAYNLRDVETEMEIGERVSRFPVPNFVWDQYAEDQRINDLGIMIDQTLARQAILCDQTCREKYTARAKEITGLENPNSPLQLKEWLEDQGVEVPSLAKKDVAKLVQSLSGTAKEMLALRQLLAKSSVKKYEAMMTCVCKDGRVHGLLQFYGANRTGRWAGRLVQVQNLPQNHIADLEVARNLIRAGTFEATELLYDSVPDVLSQLIRTAFIPKDGCKFIVADYSAVEARALSWVAGEKWRMEVFEKNGDIYSETATKMFGVPVAKNGPNAELRQKGKISELALGYGGGVGALISMGALDQGLDEEELQPMVDSWRSANPRIVRFWWDIHKAAVKAIQEKKPQKFRCFTFQYASGFLIAGLPSGRSLFYVRPRLHKNEYDRDEISYEGVTVGKHWGRIDTYGPKIVENLIQAFCRDLLAEAMQRLEAAGYKIVMHVHDEVVIEAPIDTDMKEACEIMSKTPAWAPGLVLNAAGYECAFYQKD